MSYFSASYNTLFDSKAGKRNELDIYIHSVLAAILQSLKWRYFIGCAALGNPIAELDHRHICNFGAILLQNSKFFISILSN